MKALLLLFVLACACESAPLVTGKWSLVKEQGNVWMPDRGYYAAGMVTVKNEPGIVVSGGMCHDNDLCYDTLIYLTKQKQFLQVAGLPLPAKNSLTGFTAVSSTDEVYVYGGDISSSVKANSTVYKFSAKTGQWTVFDTTGPARTQASSSLYKNKMIMFAGRPSVDAFSGYGNQLYVFDIANKQWQNVERNHSNLLWPSARSSHGSVVLGDYLYIFGGEEYKGCVRGTEMMWKLDMRTPGKWQWMPLEVPDEISCMEDMVFDKININGTNYLLLAGGWGPTSIWYDDVWLYDVNSDDGWFKVDLSKSESGPGYYRGIGWGVVGQTLTTVGGCWQDSPISCAFGHEVWTLELTI